MKQAVKWYKKAAEQGHTEAQYTLGQMCAIGGIPGSIPMVSPSCSKDMPKHSTDLVKYV